MNKIINFCIIAHIDHGKSTLADRFLEITNTVEARVFKAQYLDQMDLERERGITIKLQPVRMKYKGYILNLIDTPGHADFSYEVSRSLAAVEGAVLLVDATSGIQAQTLANLYLAIGEGLKIIPAINKIDLPTAKTDETKKALSELLGIDQKEILEISAKNGVGIKELLDKIITEIKPAETENNKPFKALIFDSKFDPFKGIVAYVRVTQGEISRNEKFYLKIAKIKGEVVEIGYFLPNLFPQKKLFAGEIGYIATGLKNVEECRVGDTLTKESCKDQVEQFAGYKEPNPVVFSSFYPTDNGDFESLRDAMEKLKSNDASMFFEPETSKALGRGFRCGFLGLLHMEIVCERLRREFDISIIASHPTVAYRITNLHTNEFRIIYSPSDFTEQTNFKIEEPWAKIEVITPKEYMGAIMKLLEEKSGIMLDTSVLNDSRVVLSYETPLAEIISNFYDKLKSISSGFASMNYEIIEFREGDLVKMDFLLAGETIDAFSRIINRKQAQKEGKRMVERLKEEVPRQNFAVSIQAAIGGKIIAREDKSAYRKDVTAKLYGGDITRKRKLLEKQKKGKQKMRQFGKINLSQEVFFNILKK